jgi:tripartite-type tricarboxylate transporter receptor subunit TctC
MAMPFRLCGGFMRIVVGMFSLGLMVLGAGAVSGQDYPNRPLRIVTGAVGGGADFLARQIAQGISAPLGQPVIVENRPPTIATETVIKSSPDGYTLLLQSASLWIFPLLQKASYDAVKDFLPISLISRDVNILAVHPSVPANSVKELIALAKARPGGLNYGSGPTGGAGHLAGELFKSMAGVDIVRALISGEVQLTISDAGSVALYVKTGKLRALAVTSTTPSALAPGLPTMAVSGVPGYEFVGLNGVFAPANTPAAVINRLNREIVRFLGSAEVKERLLTAGAEVLASSPEELSAAMKLDISRMGKLIKDLGIKVD